jgi:WD40 repeat protein
LLPRAQTRAIPTWVNAVPLTPDGRHVVSGSSDNTLRVWDLTTGQTKTTRKLDLKLILEFR